MQVQPINVFVLFAIVTLASSAAAVADEPEGGIKQLKGISIVGDKEAPKSLYIVPWHKAEYQQNTSLATRLIDSDMQVLDKASLQHQLQLYELSKSGWHRLTVDDP